VGPLHHLRAIVRIALTTVVTAVAFFLHLGARLVTPLAPEGGRRLQGAVRRAWGHATLAICGVRAELLGAAPEPPYILVSNHVSWVDILVYHAACPGGRFLAKSEIAGWPVMGLLARSAGTLFVDRARKGDLVRVNDAVGDALREGWGVIIFPEGTSTEGREVAPFKPSVFEVAIRTARPVSYAAISYETPAGEVPARLSVCWWGDMTFPDHCYRFLGLPRVRATVSFGEETLRADDRKVLAADAHAAVQRLFRPVTGALPPEPTLAESPVSGPPTA
jgi:1-acyl-sn-glycerol-3-phosphate acyltransferase